MLTIPSAMLYSDWALLLLRFLVALVFGTSGFSHLKSPQQRAESLGLSVPVTVFLGAAELAAAIALAVGFLIQWAAIGLTVIMLGSIFLKAVKWKTGFWGEKSMGWHYDLLFVAMNLVILTTGGGRIALMPQ
jgi:putative oxidoreductase